MTVWANRRQCSHSHLQSRISYLKAKLTPHQPSHTQVIHCIPFLCNKTGHCNAVFGMVFHLLFLHINISIIKFREGRYVSILIYTHIGYRLLLEIFVFCIGHLILLISPIFVVIYYLDYLCCHLMLT